MEVSFSMLETPCIAESCAQSNTLKTVIIGLRNCGSANLGAKHLLDKKIRTQVWRDNWGERCSDSRPQVFTLLRASQPRHCPGWVTNWKSIDFQLLGALHPCILKLIFITFCTLGLVFALWLTHLILDFAVVLSQASLKLPYREATDGWLPFEIPTGVNLKACRKACHGGWN